MTAQAALTPGDIEVEFIQSYLKVKEHSMVDWERQYSLYSAVRYVLAAKVPGDLVECGVWKGGSAMLMAMTLLRHGGADRTIHLFDTFAGMAEPTERDVSMDGRKVARTVWQEKHAGNRNDWCYSPLDEVRQNMAETGYPDQRLRFVQGKVEDTLPAAAPQSIALLRLDTDWYASTYHELTHLFPRLSPGGVLICDDYCYWQGQKKAVDQYMKEQGIVMLLSRVTTSAVGIKMR